MNLDKVEIYRINSINESTFSGKIEAVKPLGNNK
jgi:hypothetical protein